MGRTAAGYDMPVIRLSIRKRHPPAIFADAAWVLTPRHTASLRIIVQTTSRPVMRSPAVMMQEETFEILLAEPETERKPPKECAKCPGAPPEEHIPGELFIKRPRMNSARHALP